MKNITMKEIPSTERPYEKAFAHGIASLSDAELLSIFIKSGSKNLNALDVAYRVLDAHSIHKGIVGLNFLDISELTEIEGIGEVKAIILKALAEFSKRMNKAVYKPFISFSSPQSIANYYMEQTRYLEKEEVLLLMFDGKHNLMKETKISTGTINTSLADPRDIFIEALKNNAVYIILLHNHPSGDPTPSDSDIALTKAIAVAGELIGINLSDHIILGNGKYVSLMERGILDETE